MANIRLFILILAVFGSSTLSANEGAAPVDGAPGASDHASVFGGHGVEQPERERDEDGIVAHEDGQPHGGHRQIWFRLQQGRRAAHARQQHGHDHRIQQHGQQDVPAPRSHQHSRKETADGYQPDHAGSDDAEEQGRRPANAGARRSY